VHVGSSLDGDVQVVHAEDKGLETASGVAGGTEGDGGCEALLGQQLSRSDGFVGSRSSVRI
jgi:hypothetical protein